LAERLRTDQQIVSNWERDVAVPSRASLALLAEFFGIDVEALAQGKGFTIPDLPAPQDQPGSPLVRLLPKSRPGDLVTVSLSGGEPQVLTLSEAKALLVKAVKDTRRAWIVIDTLQE
jgi:transcriptional regulator with XRE-family HTH domain